MGLLLLSLGFTLVLLIFAWLVKRRATAMQNQIDGQHRDLGLALQGTGEALWIWHLDTQEISQIGFEPLVEGEFPKRINAIEFIQVFIHP